jgi:hypothetical protein
VTWAGVVSAVHMVSGADWTMSVGDILIALAVLLLCGEVLKSTRIEMRTVVDHASSLPCSSVCWLSSCWSNKLQPRLFPSARCAQRFCSDFAPGPARPYGWGCRARVVLIVPAFPVLS